MCVCVCGSESRVSGPGEGGRRRVRGPVPRLPPSASRPQLGIRGLTSWWEVGVSKPGWEVPTGIGVGMRFLGLEPTLWFRGKGRGRWGGGLLSVKAKLGSKFQVRGLSGWTEMARDFGARAQWGVRVSELGLGADQCWG